MDSIPWQEVVGRLNTKIWMYTSDECFIEVWEYSLGFGCSKTHMKIYSENTLGTFYCLLIGNFKAEIDKIGLDMEKLKALFKELNKDFSMFADCTLTEDEFAKEIVE